MRLFGDRSQHALQALGDRVSQLEARCLSLADQIAERDAELERLRGDCMALTKRLELTDAQAVKAASGFAQQLRALRGGQGAAARAGAPPA